MLLFVLCSQERTMIITQESSGYIASHVIRKLDLEFVLEALMVMHMHIDDKITMFFLFLETDCSSGLEGTQPSSRSNEHKLSF